MKTTINKSEVMKRAWKIYRAECNTVIFGVHRQKPEFRYALRQAWREMKREAARTTQVSAPVYNSVSPAYMAGCADYYRNAPRGTYFGD